MNTVQQESENLTFWELLETTNIEIPMVQRDYAQGRDGKERVRNDFLKALVGAIDGSPVELDFIYGSKKEEGLQPLDGQQRLTTLFLMHWYVATKEGCLTDTVKTRMKGFSYRTRTSSREFCNALIDYGVSDWDGNEDISAFIQDTHWFCPWWKKDPTIKSMLTMLSAIHKVFEDKTGIWTKLTDSGQRAITFNYIELKNFGLSDDLYIKMNARGKQLSKFECFKAGFEKRINDEQWDNGRKLTETFPYMIDTAWADLIWDKGIGIDSFEKVLDRFDRTFTRFISSCAMTALASGAAVLNDKEKRAQVEKRIQELFNDPESIVPEDFSQDGYEHLRQCLDIYCDEVKCKLSPSFPFWHYLPSDSTSIFSLLRSSAQMTYPQRVLLYAQNAYLIKKQFDLTSYRKWMRVARNIVHNSTIDSSSTFIMAINLFTELAQGSSDIYSFLSMARVSSNFASKQVKEEILKAALVSSNPSHFQVIADAEDTKFCKGEIGLLFECIDYQNRNDTFDPNELKKVADVVKTHLSEEEVSNDFRRGLLTISGNDFYEYWESWAYAVNAKKHRLVVDTRDLKKALVESDKKSYLCDLLQQLAVKDLSALLDQYVPPPEMPNWKKRLIQDPTLLRKHCQSHYIAISDDSSCCYLLKVGRPRDKSSCFKVE